MARGSNPDPAPNPRERRGSSSEGSSEHALGPDPRPRTGRSGRETWLVAAWPGMGSVAVTAGAWLKDELGAILQSELPADEFFDVEKVEVHDGIARIGALPRATFHHWENPTDGPDLLIFLGEAQPATRGLEYCHRILDVAREYGVTRAFTFAAMATPIHPGSPPRVFAVANDEDLLDTLRGHPVELLADGQIHGLNGVLLAAAAELGIGAVCLLGEMPFFAVAVPNPSASLAVLRVFVRLAGFTFDPGALREEAAAADRKLSKIFESLPQVAFEDDEDEEESFLEGIDGPEFEATEPFEPDEPEVPSLPRVSEAAKRRIEKLFAEAEKDRSRALLLKGELDRLGVFDLYEDRFLDLFKSGS